MSTSLLFLIVCNLTVSMGTINSFILYANIVRVNHAFFFVRPMTSALKIFQQVLAVFIAWLNVGLELNRVLLMAWMPTFKHGCNLPFHFTFR